MATRETESQGMLHGVNVDALRARSTDPAYAALRDRLRAHWRKADEYHRAARAKGAYYSYGALAWWSVSPGVIEAGVAHALSHDDAAIQFVVEAIDRVDHFWRNEDDPEVKRTLGKAPVQSHDEIAIAADLCRDSLPVATRDKLLALMRDCVIDCHAPRERLLYASSGSNVAYAQTCNAAVAALIWGEEAGHVGWQSVVDLAVDATRLYLRNGMDLAGHSYEGVGYGHNVAHHIYLFAQLCKQRGVVDLFALEPILERIPDASRSILFPDRSSLVNIGDHGLCDPFTMPWLLLTTKHYNRPDHLGLWHDFCGPDHPTRPFGDFGDAYELVHGHDSRFMFSIPSLALAMLWWDAAAPCTSVATCDASLSTYSPGTETCAFRTSWSTDAVLVNFLGSGRKSTSLTHAHADAGHFSIFAHGSYLAIDTGRYNASEQEHSTVLVDGKPRAFADDDTRGPLSASTRPGRIVTHDHTSVLDYAVADMAQQKDCRWAFRHLLFVRCGGDSAYSVVLDNINKDDAGHLFRWQMLTAPDNAVSVTGDRSATVTGPTAALDVTFITPPADDYPTHPHAFTLTTDNVLAHWAQQGMYANHKHTGLSTTCYNRPTLIGDLTGLNCSMTTVLAPRPLDAKPLVVTNESANRVQRVRIESEETVDTIIFACDHGMVRMPDVEAFSEVVFVRRDRAGRVTHTWASSGESIAVR